MKSNTINTKNRKEIIFKIPEFPQISETFLIAQVKTAIKLGYSVKIITRKLLTNNVHLIEKYDLLDKIIIEDYTIPKNRIVRLLKWCLLLVFNIKYFRYIYSYFKLQSKFSLTWLFQWVFYNQFANAAIIHVQYGTYKYPIDLLKATGFFKPEIIVTFHGHDAFFPLYGYIENNGYYDTLFNSDVLITANTHYLADKIIGLGCLESKIEVIPVAVDTSFFYSKEKIKKQEKVIRLITVGRLDKVKGHHFCIEVVHKLLNRGINVVLTIVGEGQERSNLETLIRKLKLENNVFLTGSKSPNSVRDVLWSHDVYLLLAVPVDVGRRETQGLATLEAQACGLPAIVFDSGGVKYTVQKDDSGFICNEYDVEEVANKVELLSNDEDLLKTMSLNAAVFVKNNFSQNKMDEKWDYIYKMMSRDE